MSAVYFLYSGARSLFLQWLWVARASGWTINEDNSANCMAVVHGIVSGYIALVTHQNGAGDLVCLKHLNVEILSETSTCHLKFHRIFFFF